MTKQPNDEPRSTDNMAAELVSDQTGLSRTLAIAPNLTYDEAVAFVAKWQGKHERIAQFVIYH